MSTAVPRPRPWRARTLLLIGLGGAVGATLRDQLEQAYPTAPGSWPWTTFWINVSGAFVLGLMLETLAVLGPDEGWRRRLRLGVGTGLLGGYTTYSSFAVETVLLGRDRELASALGYAVTSLVAGFAAAYVATVAISRAHRRVAVRRMDVTR